MAVEEHPRGVDLPRPVGDRRQADPPCPSDRRPAVPGPTPRRPGRPGQSRSRRRGACPPDHHPARCHGSTCSCGSSFSGAVLFCCGSIGATMARRRRSSAMATAGPGRTLDRGAERLADAIRIATTTASGRSRSIRRQARPPCDPMTADASRTRRERAGECRARRDRNVVAVVPERLRHLRGIRLPAGRPVDLPADPGERLGGCHRRGPVATCSSLADLEETLVIAVVGALLFLVIGVILQAWQYHRPFPSRWPVVLAFPIAWVLSCPRPCCAGARCSRGAVVGRRSPWRSASTG